MKDRAVKDPRQVKEVTGMELALALSILAITDLLVVAFGADSRDGNDWANHRRP